MTSTKAHAKYTHREFSRLSRRHQDRLVLEGLQELDTAPEPTAAEIEASRLRSGYNARRLAAMGNPLREAILRNEVRSGKWGANNAS